MKRQPSRPQRWVNAASAAREAFDNLTAAFEAMADSLGDLQGIQEEYQEWLDGMPENLADSATAEKLSEITEIDFDLDSDSSLDDFEQAVDAAESAELPRGFGRD